MSSQWFLVKDGAQQQGQFSEEQIRSLISQNPGSTFMVWKEGLPGWSDPKTLPEFQAPAPSAPPPQQPAPPPQAPAPSASDQVKRGGKLLMDGAAAHLQKVKGTNDSHAYLPHLKWVDALLNWVGSKISGGLLDNVDEWAKKIGHFALLGSAVFIFLYGLILGGKSGSFISTAGYFLLIFPAVVIVQYAAVKFLDAGKALIEKSPSSLSSRGFLECFALIVLLGVIGSVGGGIFMFIKMVSYSFGAALQTLGVGLGFGVILIYILGVTLNSEIINLKIGGDASAGQEAISIISFLMKMNLRLVPFVYGVGNAIGLILVFVALGNVIGDNWGSSMGRNMTTFGQILGLALMPFIVYLAFLIYYLFLDVLRSILVVPGKLDQLIEKGKE
ncbi:MAG: DUF4339 domain-containing protein [Acidobacteria bacterium]|nr:DUF4339 domain-containing protein [Acidobacteriota bacterium]